MHRTKRAGGPATRVTKTRTWELHRWEPWWSRVLFGGGGLLLGGLVGLLLGAAGACGP